MFSSDRIKVIVEAALPDCTVVMEGIEDGEHFSARVVSSAFTGKLPIAQHRLVYAALGDHMKRDIHALALQTFTPEKWQG